MAEVLDLPPFERSRVGVGCGPTVSSEAGPSSLSLQHHQRVGFKRGRAPLQPHDLDLRSTSASGAPHHHHQPFKRGRVAAPALAGGYHGGHPHPHHTSGGAAPPGGNAKHHADPSAGCFQKENHILKKAVAIQNEKLRSEKDTCAGLREALAGAQQQVRHLLRCKEENQALRVALSQSQEQARQLEIENYSLKVHLRKMDNCQANFGPEHNQRNRDIF